MEQEGITEVVAISAIFTHTVEQHGVSAPRYGGGVPRYVPAVIDIYLAVVYAVVHVARVFRAAPCDRKADLLRRILVCSERAAVHHPVDEGVHAAVLVQPDFLGEEHAVEVHVYIPGRDAVAYLRPGKWFAAQRLRAGRHPLHLVYVEKAQHRPAYLGTRGHGYAGQEGQDYNSRQHSCQHTAHARARFAARGELKVRGYAFFQGGVWF